MKYVATVEYADGSKSMSFKKLKDAETWLDSENNNLEYTTTITMYDDNWNVVESYLHSQGVK